MLLKAVKKINHMLSVPFCVVGSGKITFPEFLEELEELGLKSMRFGPHEYRIALERYLGISIEVALIDDLENIESQRLHVGRDDTAILWFRPKARRATIFVLASLPELEMSAAIYHELSHLAAGHSFLDRSRVGGRPRSVGFSPARLAKQPPPRTHAAREREARIREDYCMLAGALGESCLNQEQLRQVQ